MTVLFVNPIVLCARSYLLMSNKNYFTFNELCCQFPRADVNFTFPYCFYIYVMVPHKANTILYPRLTGIESLFSLAYIKS